MTFNDNGLFPPDGFHQPIHNIAKLAPIQKLHWSVANAYDVSVYVKREDLLHPVWGGNKFYKSYYYLKQLDHSQHRHVVTFGGAYSNHLLAMAGLSQLLNFKLTAVVRGERPDTLSPTLQDLTRLGTHLHFVSRESYRQGMTETLRQNLERHHGPYITVPEGGGGELGSLGCFEWGQACFELAPKVDACCLAVGTGGSCAGVLAASEDTPIYAFMALKGRSQDYLRLRNGIVTQASSIRQANKRNDLSDATLTLETSYHCGGYAKFPDYLQAFKLAFESETKMPLDKVYTAKMFYGIAEKLKVGDWAPQSKLLVLHTGGLQGNR